MKNLAFRAATALLVAAALASCDDSSPTGPSASVASSEGVVQDATNQGVTLDGAKKGGNGGGNSGGGESAMADVTISGSAMTMNGSALMPVNRDDQRRLSLSGAIPLKVKFSTTTTVTQSNCNYTGKTEDTMSAGRWVIWDDSVLLQELREIMGDPPPSDFLLENLDIVINHDGPNGGLGTIRKTGTGFLKYCVEEDGTSGGCQVTTSTEGDPTNPTRIFVFNGLANDRWVRALTRDPNAKPGKNQVELICKDMETQPSVTVKVAPVS